MGPHPDICNSLWPSAKLARWTNFWRSSGEARKLHTVEESQRSSLLLGFEGWMIFPERQGRKCTQDDLIYYVYEMLRGTMLEWIETWGLGIKQTWVQVHWQILSPLSTSISLSVKWRLSRPIGMWELSTVFRTLQVFNNVTQTRHFFRRKWKGIAWNGPWLVQSAMYPCSSQCGSQSSSSSLTLQLFKIAMLWPRFRTTELNLHPYKFPRWCLCILN